MWGSLARRLRAAEEAAAGSAVLDLVALVPLWLDAVRTLHRGGTPTAAAKDAYEMLERALEPFRSGVRTPTDGEAELVQARIRALRGLPLSELRSLAGSHLPVAGRRRGSAMNASSRLDRVMPKLSFDERLDGIVAAYREGRQADPALLATMAETDRARWNKVARVLNAVHGGLGPFVDMLESFVSRAELRLALAQQSEQLGRTFQHRGAEMAEAVDLQCQRVAMEMRQRWQELRLAELALAHFGEALGGRTLLRPEMAAKLQDCRQRLLALRSGLVESDFAAAYACELSEPSAADLERMLDLLTVERRLP